MFYLSQTEPTQSNQVRQRISDRPSQLEQCQTGFSESRSSRTGDQVVKSVTEFSKVHISFQIQEMETTKSETIQASPALETQQGEIPGTGKASEQQEETLLQQRRKECSQYLILKEKKRGKKKNVSPDAALGLATPGAGVFGDHTRTITDLGHHA